MESLKTVVTPLFAWLTVNRQCNFRCEWCFAQGAEFAKSQELTFERAMELTKILVESGIKHLFLTGGEPTLWEPLLDFNAFCNSIGLQTTIVTNAMRFGYDDFWERYTDKPNTFVGVSVKAGNAVQLIETTGVRQFDLVTKGIKRAMSHFSSGVGIVYNSHLADNLLEICRYSVEECSAHSVKIDFCTPVFVHGQPVSPAVPKPRELVSTIVKSYKTMVDISSGQLSFIMSVPFCLWPREFIEELEEEDRIESVCHLIKREGIVIMPDGSVCMCNELFDFPIGKYGRDFKDAASFIALLNRGEVNGYYDEMSRYPSKRCQECSWYAKCGGGCPLLWSIYDPENLIRPIEGR